MSVIYSDIQAKLDSLYNLLTSCYTILNSLLSKYTSSSVTTPVPTTNVLLISIVVLPANPNRKGFILYNNSANSVYVTYGATSSSASCTRLIPTFASWEVTQGCIYTGIISAIRNAGSGTVVAYELI